MKTRAVWLAALFGGALVLTCVVDLTKPPANQAPEFEFHVSADTVVIGEVYADTFHYADEDLDTLTVSLLDSLPGLLLVKDSIVRWTPGDGDIGQNTISILLEDHRGARDTLSWKVYVNSPPEFAGDSASMNANLLVGMAYTDTLRATDLNGHTLTFSFLDSVAGISRTDSIITWTPTADDTGQKRIRALVDDGTAGYDTLSWVLTVKLFFQTGSSVSGFSARSGHQVVVFSKNLWLLGGIEDGANRKNDVWSSSNGKNWTIGIAAADFSPRNRHAATVFDNKIWIIGGHGRNDSLRNDVWFSVNGKVWDTTTTSASFSPREGHSVVVFTNKLWVIGGKDASGSSLKDVWVSEDGVTWTQATANAAFGGRCDHTALAFGDKLWVIGGNSANDVWYSLDGTQWTQATNAAAFSGRGRHGSVVYDNRLWVIGGYDGNDCLSDVWYSSDGTEWILGTRAGGFVPRFGHTLSVFGTKMWLVGGVKYDGGKRYRSDVWWHEAE